MTITKRRPQPGLGNHIRAASCGEVARLQKQAQWKKVAKRHRSL